MDDEVALLISQLFDDNLEVRLQAAENLGRLRAVAAIPMLCLLLHNDETHKYVRNSVEKSDDAAVLFARIAMAEDESHRLRLHVVEALGQIGAPALPALVRMLYAVEALPIEASYALGRIGPAAMPLLLAALGEGRPDVRWRAAAALGYTGDVSACPALLEVVRNDVLRVRWTAAFALLRLGHPGGIRPLFQEFEARTHGGFPYRTGTVSEFSNLVYDIGVPAVPALLDYAHDRSDGLAIIILRRLGGENTLPRAILSDSQLSIAEKIDALQRLRKVRMITTGRTIRYDLPDALAYCRELSNEEGEVGDAARLIVSHMTLLRSAQNDVAKASHELLRPTEPGALEVKADEMLRAGSSLPDRTAATPARRPWRRLFSRSKKGGRDVTL